MTGTNDISDKRKAIDFTFVADDFRAISCRLKRLAAWRPQWLSGGAGGCPLDELSARHLQDIGLERLDNETTWTDSRGAPLTALRDFDYRGRQACLAGRSDLA